MVREIHLYIEGGGRDNTSRKKMRRGFSEFLDPLRKLARERRLEWSVILCGSRNDAFDNFKFALRAHPAAFNLLLVDSESKVAKSVWQHLEEEDRWQAPDLPEEHCHLMVRCMETWLSADGDALAVFYGQGFRKDALPSQPNLEEVEKERILEALERAVRGTSKGRYDKVDDGAALLARIRPARVRSRAPHCDRLFRIIEGLIQSSGSQRPGTR